MSNEETSTSLDLELRRAERRLYDVLCRDFEALLRGDDPNTLRQYIGRYTGEIQHGLFYQLLLVELEYRVSRGPPPSATEYLTLYSDRAAVVGTAFETLVQWGLIDPIIDLDAQVRDAGQLAQKQIGDYRILAELGQGEGAFAKVYHAKDLSGRDVAIKITDRASLEATSLMLLNHPDIVKLHHYTQLPGEPARHLVCMEYVPSMSLRSALELLDSQGSPRSGEALAELLAVRFDPGALRSKFSSEIQRMDWPTFVAWLGSRVAGAVAYAHGQKVQHRDLKPANILIDRYGHPKLVDFNVSFISDDQLSLDSLPADCFGGSLPYMAPEHLAAYAARKSQYDVGKPADVYSLGVVLFELLVGHRPVHDRTFAGPTVTHIADALRLQIESTPPKFPADCPQELRWILEQCMQVDPSQRPIAEELSRRLQYFGSLELQQRVVPKYRYGEAAFPRIAVGVYLLTLVLVCYLPSVPVLLVGAVLYHGLVLYSIPGALTVWDPSIAWPAGAVLGTVGVLFVIAVSIWYIGPAITAIATRDRGFIGRDFSIKVANRCFLIGLVAASATVVAWSLIGLAIPLTIIFFGKGHFTLALVLDNVWQSTMHGLLGFSPTFLLVTFLAVEFLVLRLIPRAEMSGASHWIPRIRQWAIASRLFIPAATVALVFRVLMRAEMTPDVGVYLQSLALFAFFYVVLNEFLAERLETVLRTAQSVLQKDLAS